MSGHKEMAVDDGGNIDGSTPLGAGQQQSKGERQKFGPHCLLRFHKLVSAFYMNNNKANIFSRKLFH